MEVFLLFKIIKQLFDTIPKDVLSLVSREKLKWVMKMSETSHFQIL